MTQPSTLRNTLALLALLATPPVWAQDGAAFDPPPAFEESDFDDTDDAVDDATAALTLDVQPAQEPTLDDFERALDPYGTWTETADYGLVWVPSVDFSWWRPYAHGRWVYTDAGWTFVSRDPWGHITFHYGRWAYWATLGWFWIPGFEWAPAWVTWRWGTGIIAWAPLGPVGVAPLYYETPSLWLAVQIAWFVRPLHRHRFVPTRRVHDTFRHRWPPRRRRPDVRRTGPPRHFVDRRSARPAPRAAPRPERVPVL